MKHVPLLLLVLGIVSISAAALDTTQIDNETLEKAMDFAQRSRAFNDFTVGNNLFAADVYKLLKANETQSFVVSPFLAEHILAMVYNGARGRTAQELSSGLHLPKYKEDIKKAMQYMDLYLEHGLDELCRSTMYVSDRYKIHDEFKTTSADFFKTDIQNIDFGNRTAAAAEINRWIAEENYNKLKGFVDEDDLEENTSAMLINAMYAHQTWLHNFPSEATKPFPFYLDKYTEIHTTTMKQIAEINYYYSPELDAEFINLPYFTIIDYTCTIVLPSNIENLSLLEKHLPEVLAEHKYENRLIELRLPKFEIQSRIDFKPILEALGVVEAFTNHANFKDIAEKLKINKFIQQITFTVEEEGLTNDMWSLRRLDWYINEYKPSATAVYADHPFIFYIKMKDTIILIGRYTGR